MKLAFFFWITLPYLKIVIIASHNSGPELKPRATCVGFMAENAALGKVIF